MKKTIKTLQELNLEDDFLFSRVMSDKEVCRAVVEKLLDVKIREVKLLTTQSTIDPDFEGKGIRLDVYVEDDAGTVFAVEMQNGREKDLPRRTRYYQGNIDLDLIQKGEPYSKLRKSYVIFICTFDFFKKGRYKYTFENVCLEDESVKLNDDTQKIVLSTKGKIDDVDEELKEFLKYVETSTDETANKYGSPLLKKVHNRVSNVKSDRRTEVEYMTLLERDRQNFEDGLEEGLERGKRSGLEEGLERGKRSGLEEGLERGKRSGLEEGLERGKLEVARSMKQKGLSDEIIVEVTGLALKTIEAL